MMAQKWPRLRALFVYDGILSSRSGCVFIDSRKHVDSNGWHVSRSKQQPRPRDGRLLIARSTPSANLYDDSGQTVANVQLRARRLCCCHCYIANPPALARRRRRAGGVPSCRHAVASRGGGSANINRPRLCRLLAALPFATSIHGSRFALDGLWQAALDVHVLPPVHSPYSWAGFRFSTSSGSCPRDPNFQNTMIRNAAMRAAAPPP